MKAILASVSVLLIAIPTARAQALVDDQAAIRIYTLHDGTQYRCVMGGALDLYRVPLPATPVIIKNGARLHLITDATAQARVEFVQVTRPGSPAETTQPASLDPQAPAAIELGYNAAHTLVVGVPRDSLRTTVGAQRSDSYRMRVTCLAPDGRHVPAGRTGGGPDMEVQDP